MHLWLGRRRIAEAEGQAKEGGRMEAKDTVMSNEQIARFWKTVEDKSL